MSRLMRVLLALALASLMMGAVACGDDEESDPTAQEETDEEPTEAPEEETSGEVTISATEYAFDLPATLPAGTTTFTLQNDGAEPHFIQIVELQAEAPPVAELIQLPQKKAEAFFVREVAETDLVEPGEASQPFEAELTAGRYGYVCFFALKGDPPHAFQGMNGEFIVE